MLTIFVVNAPLAAQTDLDSLLNSNMEEPTSYTFATFKSTRIISGQSIERMQQHDLDFRISHRFGEISSGPYELFGLDYSSSHFGLEYGVMDWLMIGVGRATFEKTFNGFAKVSLLRQSTGQRKMPVSVSYVMGGFINSLKWTDTTRTNYFSSRLSYIHQLLIARKLNRRISVQLSPTLIHRNMVEMETHENDIMSVGFGGRVKLSNRTSINMEYFYILNKDNLSSSNLTNPLSIGFDIETGSHIFQIHISNATAMTENAFLGKTTGSWKDGDIHIGFNITRVFTLRSDKKYDEEETLD